MHVNGEWEAASGKQAGAIGTARRSFADFDRADKPTASWSLMGITWNEEATASETHVKEENWQLFVEELGIHVSKFLGIDKHKTYSNCWSSSKQICNHLVYFGESNCSLMHW